MERIFQSVFGIQVGDMVTTSYGTGPYEVWSIYGPHYTEDAIGRLIVRDYPVISLTLIAPGVPPRGDNGRYWINDIWQEGDRYITDGGDEVFVRRSDPPPLPVDMLRSYPTLPQPYPFDPSVDYAAGERRVWRCSECARDFNAVPEGRYGHAACPSCQRSWCVDEIVLVKRAAVRFNAKRGREMQA